MEKSVASFPFFVVGSEVPLGGIHSISLLDLLGFPLLAFLSFYLRPPSIIVFLLRASMRFAHGDKELDPQERGVPTSNLPSSTCV